MNPYTPPTAPLAQDPAGGRISPERAAALQAELKSLNMRSFALGIPGMILQWVGNGMIGGVVGLGVFVLGTALLIVGLYFYAKMRGLHAAFSVLGLLSCVGLLILYFLPKKCLACRTSSSYSAKECSRCAAPLGA